MILEMHNIWTHAIITQLPADLYPNLHQPFFKVHRVAPTGRSVICQGSSQGHPTSQPARHCPVSLAIRNKPGTKLCGIKRYGDPC